MLLKLKKLCFLLCLRPSLRICLRARGRASRTASPAAPRARLRSAQHAAPHVTGHSRPVSVQRRSARSAPAWAGMAERPRTRATLALAAQSARSACLLPLLLAVRCRSTVTRHSRRNKTVQRRPGLQALAHFTLHLSLSANQNGGGGVAWPVPAARRRR